MTYRANLKMPSLAVMALLAAAGFTPSIAFAQNASSGPSLASTDKAAQKPIDKTEARVKELHAKLKITPAQDPQWQDFVSAERDNAQQMSDLIAKREQMAGSMNAVDDFKNYETIAKAHEDGLEKIVPAFEKLYASMSDDQKKMADNLFKGTGQGAGKKGS
jgi:hypothetical protein